MIEFSACLVVDSSRLSPHFLCFLYSPISAEQACVTIPTVFWLPFSNTTLFRDLPPHIVHRVARHAFVVLLLSSPIDHLKLRRFGLKRVRLLMRLHLSVRVCSRPFTTLPRSASFRDLSQFVLD